MARLMDEDRAQVAQVARLQTELQQTRANIRKMEMKLRSAAREEEALRSRGNSSVDHAMEAVLSAKSYLEHGSQEDGDSAGALVVVAATGDGAPMLDTNTAAKLRGWYQAEVDRLAHQVARLEAQLERRDEAVDKLRKEMHDLRMGHDNQLAELQLTVSRGKIAMDEKVETLSSEHRRAIAAKEEHVRASIEEIRKKTTQDGQALVRRTRAVVACERVVRRLYQRRMWQGWSTWARFAFDKVRCAVLFCAVPLRLVSLCCAVLCCAVLLPLVLCSDSHDVSHGA